MYYYYFIQDTKIDDIIIQIVLSATHNKFYGLEDDLITEILINIVGSYTNGLSNPVIHRVIETIFDLFNYTYNKYLFTNIQQKIAKSQSKFILQRDFLDHMDNLKQNMKKLSILASDIFSILGFRCEGERCLYEPSMYESDSKNSEEVIQDVMWKVVHSAEVEFLIGRVCDLSDKYNSPNIEYIQKIKPYINELCLNVDNRNIVTSFIYLIKTLQFKYNITTINNHEVSYKAFSLELLCVLIDTTRHTLLRDIGFINIVKKMFIPLLLNYCKGEYLLNNMYYDKFIDLTYFIWKY